MKLSLQWLCDFVAFTQKNPQKIAERLTLGVAEVERIEVQGELLEQCVVGKILSLGKHSNADKLSLCNVQTDRGVKRVVCGGINLRVGMPVAFAHIGAKVKWHGGEIQELQKAKIRGEESEGMICAAEELDLTRFFPNAIDRSIIDLETCHLKVGQPLREALGLTDVIFHIDNNAISHRPDLFSHIGFARECIALGLGRGKKRTSPAPLRFAKTAVPFRCRVDIRHLVPRYCACLVEVDALGETPSWMIQRLAAVGIRSLNLPVDITNYVAAEAGMPLHSFDADALQGDVHFRLSRNGEKITTLDGIERTLPEGAIVLSDSAGIFDLMGIMGGLRSSTKRTTKRLYLHAAIVNPASIRRTVTALNHRTEASTVYEKGVPPIAAEQGLHRALQLLLELVPGAKIGSKLESYGNNGKAVSIPLSLERAAGFLGRTVSAKEATSALVALDFNVTKKLIVTPPLHRLRDMHTEADLLEEIARTTGFERYEPDMPSAPLTRPEAKDPLHRLRGALQEAGFTEVVQLAFLGETLLQKTRMETVRLQELENPLGEEVRYLRPSLLPRLLEVAQKNSERASGTLRLFEVGHVFSSSDERLSLLLLTVSTQDSGLEQEPFFLAKHAIGVALSVVGFSPIFQRLRTVDPSVHPARASEMRVEKQVVGSLYEVHPSVCRAFALPHRAAVASIDLTALLKLPQKESVHHEISAFPAVSYDVTVPVGPREETAALLSKVRGSATILRSLELVDVFQKEQQRHLTFRCTYGDPHRTLTEDEVRPIHEKVEAALRGGNERTW